MGEALGIISVWTVCDLDDVLLCGLITLDPLHDCLTRVGGFGPFDLRGGPIATGLLNLADETFEVDVAGRDQRHIIGAVTALEIFSHLGRRQGAHGLCSPQHAVPQRMRAEECRHRLFVGTKGRLVIVFADFLNNHFFLNIKIGVPQRWPHHIGQQVDSMVLVVRYHGHVIDRLFLAGIRVRLRSDFVHFAN